MTQTPPFDGRRWHDMGGSPAGPMFDGAPDVDHDYALWEKRVDALMVLCSAKGHFTVDGLRRVLEDMGPEALEKYSYYDRWIAATSQNLIEAGVITQTELADRMAQITTRGGTYGDATDG